ncbi:hypothetical protein Nepgr_000532 [Nepenthes gracilis]|uniref:Uncharacterized protein n=1 Tax=Nepenthes gracilis TaxID=150966 RepID=A0AAD3P3M2_NEPGR|nr:hypothetical protein Nepgr_000532 [Nepenthes gracilis]
MDTMESLSSVYSSVPKVVADLTVFDCLLKRCFSKCCCEEMVVLDIQEDHPAELYSPRGWFVLDDSTTMLAPFSWTTFDRVVRASTMEPTAKKRAK